MSYPILFPPNEKEFKTFGLGMLPDVISISVDEKRNGLFEVTMTYPVWGHHYSDIEKHCYLYCTHDESMTCQAYEIYYISKPFNGKVKIKGYHISYQLNDDTTLPCSATSATAALLEVQNHSLGGDFTFWTDKNSTGTFELTKPTATRSVLGGIDGSILDVFGGGEYEWDMYTVKLYQDRGSDNGVTIEYGKNLTDIVSEEDSSNVYTGCVPYYTSSDGVSHYITTDPIVKSSFYDEFLEVYGRKNIIPLDCSDLIEGEDDTENDVVFVPTDDQLKQAASTYMEANKVWLASQSITVDFVALWQTEEYENVAPLQRVRLCDWVTVKYPKLGVEVKAQVIEVVWDVLKERYSSITLGDAKSTLSQTITKDLSETLSNVNRVLATKTTKSELASAISKATELMTGGEGGEISIEYNDDGTPSEILILSNFTSDNHSKATALGVIRMNQNGIGISTSGINGPYTTAMTTAGIVADLITAGTLTANLVKAGILADETGTNYWNMETGEMSISTGTKLGDTTIGDRFTVTEEGLTNRVTSAEAESLIEQKADEIRLKADKISWTADNSSMDEDGNLVANSAKFESTEVKNSEIINGTVYGDMIVNYNPYKLTGSGSNVNNDLRTLLSTGSLKFQFSNSTAGTSDLVILSYDLYSGKATLEAKSISGQSSSGILQIKADKEIQLKDDTEIDGVTQFEDDVYFGADIYVGHPDPDNPVEGATYNFKGLSKVVTVDDTKLKFYNGILYEVD